MISFIPNPLNFVVNVKYQRIGLSESEKVYFCIDPHNDNCGAVISAQPSVFLLSAPHPKRFLSDISYNF